MALVLRKAVMPKNVSLFKCIKGRNLATAANKQNPAVLTKCAMKMVKRERNNLVKHVPYVVTWHPPAASLPCRRVAMARSASCPQLGSYYYKIPPKTLRPAKSATTVRETSTTGNTLQHYMQTFSYLYPNTSTNCASAPAGNPKFSGLSTTQKVAVKEDKDSQCTSKKVADKKSISKTAVNILEDMAKCAVSVSPKCAAPCPCGCGTCTCGPCGCPGGCCPCPGTCAGGCSLPPPCQTPPKCIQYMTGYYYYPYGFWFCGPYHVCGTCVPGGPCRPGPCGPCGPAAPCPCGPCCLVPDFSALMASPLGQVSPKYPPVDNQTIEDPISKIVDPFPLADKGVKNEMLENYPEQSSFLPNKNMKQTVNSHVLETLTIVDPFSSSISPNSPMGRCVWPGGVAPRSVSCCGCCCGPCGCGPCGGCCGGCGCGCGCGCGPCGCCGPCGGCCGCPTCCCGPCGPCGPCNCACGCGPCHCGPPGCGPCGCGCFGCGCGCGPCGGCCGPCGGCCGGCCGCGCGCGCGPGPCCVGVPCLNFDMSGLQGMPGLPGMPSMPAEVSPMFNVPLEPPNYNPIMNPTPLNPKKPMKPKAIQRKPMSPQPAPVDQPDQYFYSTNPNAAFPASPPNCRVTVNPNMAKNFPFNAPRHCPRMHRLEPQRYFSTHRHCQHAAPQPATISPVKSEPGRDTHKPYEWCVPERVACSQMLLTEQPLNQSNEDNGKTKFRKVNPSFYNEAVVRRVGVHLNRVTKRKH